MINMGALKKLGLSKTEASIFLLLIEKGPASLKDIAKKVKFKEKEVKIFLQRMINKKYITPVIKDKTTYLYANHNLLGMHF